MSDRPLTPHELHLKAISVTDQLERLAGAARDGRATRAHEVGVVTAAAAALRWRVEQTAAEPTPVDDVALEDLACARAEVARALDLVVELTDRVPVAGPGASRKR